MLHLTIPPTELFNETTQEFSWSKEVVVSLEHSLVSISKWEAKHRKPFLSKESKSYDEAMDYVRCMIVRSSSQDDVVNFLSNDHIATINEYIESPMTATWYKQQPGGSRRIVTSELIYYWMIALNIPFECQKWHLNRLLTLIAVCNFENAPKKKLSNKELYARNASINAARKAKLKGGQHDW